MTTSLITVSGFLRSIPTFEANGSHHAPIPRMIRPGAKSSSVEKVEASLAGFLVQQSTTPEPIFIFSVFAANAAIGTTASLTRRESACQTASKPLDSAYFVYSIASSIE